MADEDKHPVPSPQGVDMGGIWAHYVAAPLVHIDGIHVSYTTHHGDFGNGYYGIVEGMVVCRARSSKVYDENILNSVEVLSVGMHYSGKGGDIQQDGEDAVEDDYGHYGLSLSVEY